MENTKNEPTRIESTPLGGFKSCQSTATPTKHMIHYA